MPFTIAQITDTHLLDEREESLRGVVPWHSLQAVLAEVIREQPDLLLLTGDLADMGSAAAYQPLLDAIAPVGIPAYWLAGNHDGLLTISKVLDRSWLSPLVSIRRENWQIIGLNAIATPNGWGEGELTEETLAWLTCELQAHRDRPVLIALHHHPIPVGIDWLDLMGLKNGEKLLAIIDCFVTVKLVLFGHVHQAFAIERGAVSYYGCPSTFDQVIFNKNCSREFYQPGFRLLRLYPDGSHQTRVCRVVIANSRSGSR